MCCGARLSAGDGCKYYRKSALLGQKLCGKTRAAALAVEGFKNEYGVTANDACCECGGNTSRARLKVRTR